MDFKIEKVLERDIDLLVINNFLNGNLLDLFLDKVNLRDHKIISIEHSYKDIDLGESDITVVVGKENHKVGLLIEDKIDAIAMDLQPERYIERGKKGILDGTYNEFKTFIIAPKRYLDTNIYAKKYQNQIAYEDMIKYFADDIYGKTLINKAIEEKEYGYIVIENEMVTKFWARYYEFIRLNYPQIRIHEVESPRGTDAGWPRLFTDYKQVKIIHKTNKGYMDLTFNRMANYIDVFNKYVKLRKKDLKIVKTGKSIAVRLNVPIIDFKSDFDDYINEMHECMKKALQLYDVLLNINVLSMYNEINKR